MADTGSRLLQGVIVEEELGLTLAQLSRACAAEQEQLVVLVECGAIEPRGTGRGSWRFTGTSLRRARVALRLQRDLDINPPGLALVLDLLEEIESLRGAMAPYERN